MIVLLQNLLSQLSPIANWFGSLAAFCTTVAFIPQVTKTITTKDVNGISLGMYSVFSFGVLMWLIYGILLHSWPMMIANVITFILAFTVLVFKIKYQTKPPKPPQDLPPA